VSPSSDHLAWAETAFSEATSLEKTARYRWAAVAYFYSALHMVHFALPTMDTVPDSEQHPDVHSGPYGTLSVVRKHAGDLYKPYNSLFSTSIDVRYYGCDVAPSVAQAHRHTDIPLIGEWACTMAHGSSCSCWLRGL
jgi:hypothetical protein